MNGAILSPDLVRQRPLLVEAVSTASHLFVTGPNGVQQLTPASPRPSGGAAGPDSGCSQDGARYFSVMWCKASKKKHKRWEGDAVLVTRGRVATLKDMEGKDIGKGETRAFPPPGVSL